MGVEIIYENKELAEAEVKRQDNIAPEVYCPLIKSFCRPDCVCLGSARIYKRNDKYVAVYPRHCNNAMFFGE